MEIILSQTHHENSTVFFHTPLA